MLDAGGVQLFLWNERPPLNVLVHVEELLETLGVLDVVHTVSFRKPVFLRSIIVLVVRAGRAFGMSRLSNAAGAFWRYICEQI